MDLRTNGLFGSVSWQKIPASATVLYSTLWCVQQQCQRLKKNKKEKKGGLTTSPTDAIMIIVNERGVNKMKNVVEISKRSKKEQKAYYAMQRGVNGFNTGTRTMKTAKNPTREMQKDAWRKGREI